MNHKEILHSAGLIETDYRTGKTGYNLAAILLFGRDDVIRSCAPGFMTDAIRRVDNLDRYDDRVMVGTNLIEAYEQLMDFISRHTLDRFFLVDNQRVSVRSWIAREIVSNILVHREYSKGFLARIIIERDRIFAENWNKPSRHGRLTLEDIKPDSKNPLLAQFFINIGRADRLGSGIRNLYRYTRIYSGDEPQLIEDDIFTTVVPLNNEANGVHLDSGTQVDTQAGTQASTQASTQAGTQVGTQASTQAGTQVGTQAGTQVKLTQQVLSELLIFCETPRSRKEMQAFCEIKTVEYFRKSILIPMLEIGLVRMTIPDKPNSPKQKYVKK